MLDVPKGAFKLSSEVYTPESTDEVGQQNLLVTNTYQHSADYGTQGGA